MAKFEEVWKKAPPKPDIPPTLKWYQWNQNNSGGSFHVDENITHRLFIEAYTYEEADSIAQTLGVYYDGCETGVDCDCCGDRWYSGDELELPVDYGSEQFNTVEEYAEMLTDKYGWCSPDAYIYYHDGRKVAVSSDRV